MARAPEIGDPPRGVTIGDVHGSIVNSIIAGGNIVKNFFVSDYHDRRNQLILLTKVRSQWIRGVLEQSLHHEAMIELGMVEMPDAIDSPWNVILDVNGQEPSPLSKDQKIFDIFKKMEQSLLILGDPGSGKTTTLLELAREAADCAQEDPTQPIPVVFNLSSWADKRLSLRDWLVEEMNVRFLDRRS